MTTPTVQPGQVIDVWSCLNDGEVKNTILETELIEVMRLHVAQGHRVPLYQSQSEITILCLQGRVEIETAEHTSLLSSGQLTYLRTSQQFSIACHEEASLLVSVFKNPASNTVG